MYGLLCDACRATPVAGTGLCNGHDVARGFLAQRHAENALFRCTQIFGARLRAKQDASQEREASLACQLLNRMRELRRPESSAVS